MAQSAQSDRAVCISALACWLFASGAQAMLAGQANPNQSETASNTNEVLSKRGYYLVEYTTEPTPIPLNEMFEMRVEIRERHKKSLAKRVSLEVEAGMSAHNHGMNTLPKVELGTDGSFRVKGMLFHMPGKWNMTFIITRGLIKDKAETEVVQE